jgi:hypothetical protein
MQIGDCNNIIPIPKIFQLHVILTGAIFSLKLCLKQYILQPEFTLLFQALYLILMKELKISFFSLQS